MKLYVGLLAATAAMALAGPSRAADGDNFIIRGDATKTILEQNEINIATQAPGMERRDLRLAGAHQGNGHAAAALARRPADAVIRRTPIRA